MTKPEFRQTYGKDIRYTYWIRNNFPTIRVLVAKEQRNFITYINESGKPNVILKKKALWCNTNIASGQELFLKYDANYPRDYVI